EIAAIAPVTAGLAAQTAGALLEGLEELRRKWCGGGMTSGLPLCDRRMNLQECQLTGELVAFPFFCIEKRGRIHEFLLRHERANALGKQPVGDIRRGRLLIEDVELPQRPTGVAEQSAALDECKPAHPDQFRVVARFGNR